MMKNLSSKFLTLPHETLPRNSLKSTCNYNGNNIIVNIQCDTCPLNTEHLKLGWCAIISNNNEITRGKNSLGWTVECIVGWNGN